MMSLSLGKNPGVLTKGAMKLLTECITRRSSELLLPRQR